MYETFNAPKWLHDCMLSVELRWHTNEQAQWPGGKLQSRVIGLQTWYQTISLHIYLHRCVSRVLLITWRLPLITCCLIRLVPWYRRGTVDENCQLMYDSQPQSLKTPVVDPMLIQCSTLGQHWINIGSTSRVCWDDATYDKSDLSCCVLSLPCFLLVTMKTVVQH